MLFQRLRHDREHVSLVTRRRRRALIVPTTSVSGRRGIGLISGFVFVKPFEVFGVLDGNVGVLDYGHENVLHNRDHKEEEAVHEERCVDEVDLFNRCKCVEQRVATLD